MLWHTVLWLHFAAAAAAAAAFFLQTWINDARNIFTGVTGGSSTGYAFLTAALLASGLGYIVAPVPTLQGVFGSSVANAGPESIVLWQLIGAGVSMLVAPWALSLKVGAAASHVKCIGTFARSYMGLCCLCLLIGAAVPILVASGVLNAEPQGG
jgi:hypothetical protein